MNSYQVTTVQNVTYGYQATDMLMALHVHQAVNDDKAEVIRCELVTA